MAPPNVDRSLPSRFLGIVQRPATIVFLVATVLALVVTFPVVLNFNQDIYGAPGDATGGVTQYWWWGYALQHGLSVFDNTLEGAPLGSEWWQIPFPVLPLVIFAPLTVLIGPIASYNLLVISAFPLTAWATYLLMRRLNFPPLAAAFAGFAFAFWPYRIEKAQGHANQTHMEFMVLTLYFLVRWYQGGRKRDAALAGVMVGLQMWMDYSLSYVLAVGLPTFFVVSIVVRNRDVPWTRWIGQNVVAGLITCAVGALFVPLMLVTFHRPGTGPVGAALAGVHRNFTELGTYSARIYEYFEPFHANPLLPAALRNWEDAHLHGSNWTESTLTLGFIVMALALAGFLLHRQRFTTALSIGLVVVGLVISEPPQRHFLGVTINTPSYYLYQFITFFRVYARFTILVMLGMTMLAAAGFAAIQGRLGTGRQQILMLLPFLVLAGEFNNLPPSHTTAILPAPAEYTWLAQQPQGTLIEYPAHSGEPGRLEIEIRQYMLYQMVHLHPTFLNEAANVGVVADAAAQLEPYYKPGVAARLKAYGVKYVFVHRDDYAEDGWMLPTNVDGLTYVTTLNGVDIYLVN